MGSSNCNNGSKRQRQMIVALALSLLGGNAYAFQRPALMSPLTSHGGVARPTLTKSFSTLDKEDTKTAGSKTAGSKATLVDPSHLATEGVNGAIEPTVLDLSSYENSLLSAWDEDETLQKGFDWEIEKLRRYFAGLRQREDGKWVRQPSLFDFLVTHTPEKIVGVDVSGQRYEMPPKPVNVLDVGVLITKNLLNGLGFGPSLGMAAVPDAVIQKYEGSFFSFIKGALGGDLQTLAGGPLFLLLAKYYQDYGPIFNLSFGPKSFLVISDPVMARHILRDSR